MSCYLSLGTVVVLVPNARYDDFVTRDALVSCVFSLFVVGEEV